VSASNVVRANLSVTPLLNDISGSENVCVFLYCGTPKFESLLRRIRRLIGEKVTAGLTFKISISGSSKQI
jgi:hypothetical protein